MKTSSSNITQAYLGAGPNLTITGPSPISEEIQYNGPNKSPSYGPVNLPAGFVPVGGGAFTFSAAGGSGAAVGSFSVTATLPAPLNWTNVSAASAINHSQGLTVTWTGTAANQYVLIDADSKNSGSGVSASLICIAPADPGQFTIPAQALLSLPVSTSADMLLANFLDIPTFTASGLDLGYAISYQASVTTAASFQ